MPDIVDFSGDELFPSVVLDDSDPWKIFIDAFGSFIGPEQSLFSESKTFGSNFILRNHSNSKHKRSHKSDPSYFKHQQHNSGDDHGGSTE